MPYTDVEKRRARAMVRNSLKRSGNWIPAPPTRTGDNLVCPQCNKEFYRSPANRSRGGEDRINYCSRDCMKDAFMGRFVKDNSPRWKGRIVYQCDNCGKEIPRPIWYKPGEKSFCDSSCFGEWKSKNWTGEDNPCWRGGHAPYYGANWLRQQREARKRDGYKCQMCGVDESDCRRALDVHHIVPFRMFGVENCKKANALSNLVSLCDGCHRFAEQPSQKGTIKTWAELMPLVMAIIPNSSSPAD